MDRPVPYPWEALERIDRSAVAALHAARECLGAWDLAAVERELSAILGQSVRILDSVPLPAAPATWPGCAPFTLQTLQGDCQLTIELEAALAARLVSALLKRPPPLVDPASPVPDSVQGAAAALAMLVCRRLGSPTVLQSFGAVRSPSACTLGIHATLLLQDESFACQATLRWSKRPTRGASCFDAATLQRLGGLQLGLPLVVAVVQVPRALVHGLRTRDVLVPGGSWLVERAAGVLRGRPVLCAPASERGLRVELLDAGRIVLGEGTMSLESEEQSVGATAADVLADAPVVVRIELGQVSMSARQWAALRPGDIIASSARVADRAVLRIGGREVARGELVDIEGELGVRIHELLNGEPQ